MPADIANLQLIGLLGLLGSTPSKLNGGSTEPLNAKWPKRIAPAIIPLSSTTWVPAHRVSVSSPKKEDLEPDAAYLTRAES